jgi:TPP-dependent pyruvate/acetoin dehydrogenase alpha subunit
VLAANALQEMGYSDPELDRIRGEAEGAVREARDTAVAWQPPSLESRFEDVLA